MTNLELADALQAEFPGYEVVDVAAAELRNLHTENTALRVTEDNLRQELQECQDQRRAAFRRIEELEALRAQIGQGVPVAWTTGIKWHPISHYQSEQVQKLTREAQPEHGFTIPLYTHPAPQQIGQGVPDEMPTSAAERHLRLLLAVRVGMQNTYFEEGEAHGAEHGISIDFMREPVAHIDAKLRALNVARAECAPQQKPLTDEHVTDGTKCWCDPELNYKDPYTGVEVWVHRSKQ